MSYTIVRKLLQNARIWPKGGCSSIKTQL